MAWVVLCREDGLWAMLPERSGGDTYSLRRLDPATAESLAAMVALGSGCASVVDLGRFEAAAARLAHAELVQAITAAMLLGGSGRPLSGLLPALQQCSEAVPGLPALPAAVLTSSSAAFGGGSEGGDSGKPGSPSVFELMHQLSKHSAQAAASRPAIQLDAAPGQQQARQLPDPLQVPGPAPAAALAAGGSELWVRWGASASDWCLFQRAPGERPCARCSCCFAGFGLLFCEHLASAYRTFVAPCDGTGISVSSGGGSSGAAAGGAAAVALDVEELEAACAEASLCALLNPQQLAKLLLCTALYTGAATVLQAGLGLDLADLRPPGGAGQDAGTAALAAGMPSARQLLVGPGARIGTDGQPVVATQSNPAPGCALGSWRAAAPPTAGPVGCGTVTLLQHAALQLPPASAEGLWLAKGMATGLTGLTTGHPAPTRERSAEPGGRQLLAAAQLLLDTGHAECGRHLLQEWVVALSLAPAWLVNADEWRPGLVQLWRQHMPAAAAVDWWMQQTGAPGGSDGRCSLSRQQQRLSAICSTDYLSLIGELLGPVAAAQLTSAVIAGLSGASSRGAARGAAIQPNHAYNNITDLTNPAGQAGGWLTRCDAEGVGGACNLEHLLRLLKMQLDGKASKHSETQQAERPTSPGGGRRGGRRRGQQGRGAGGRGAAAAGQGGPQLPPRCVGEAPTLLQSAARGVAERMLSLPLDQAVRLFDSLVPDLEPVVLGEVAALQCQQLHAVQADLPDLLKQVQETQRAQQARQAQQTQQPATEAAPQAAAGPPAAASAAPSVQQAQQVQHQQGQQQGQQQQASQVQQAQQHLRLQDLAPNQLASVIDQLINRLPTSMRRDYRQVLPEVLAGGAFFQHLFEQQRGELRIPAPAGPGADQQAHAPPQPRGLLALLEAAVAPQPASSKRRLAFAALFSAEQLCKKHGWAAMRQLEAEEGAGWRHLISLLERAQPQHCAWSYDLLPAALAAVAYIFTEANHAPSKSQQRKLKKPAKAANVPWEAVAQLVDLLPCLLEACCDAASEALHGCSVGGSSGSHSSGGGDSGAAASAASAAAPGGGDAAQAGGPAAATRSGRRSLVADRDALALALSGIHSCFKLASGLFDGDWPSCLSMQHTSVPSRLRRSMPGSLVGATSLLLEAAVAADQAAAEVFIGLYLSVPHDWTVELERAAGALLPLVPWILPPVKELSLPGTSAAAASAVAALIGSRDANLDSLRPQLLAAAAALQRVRFSAPVRRNSLALLCRCLQAVSISQGAAAVERQQAAEALLRLIISPAMAGEMERSELAHADTRQLIECALAAATAALQSGGSDAGLGGELAYLAVNLLAYSARVAEVPLVTADAAAARAQASGAGRSKQPLLAAQHSGWQLAALQVVEWWQGRTGGGTGGGGGAGSPGQLLSGSPPPLFCASTLMALLLRTWEPAVQAAAVAALQRLTAADPLLLLQCDSLPQLVHLVSRQAFLPQGTSKLQGAVDTLLSSVRAAATAAGRVEQHMWPVWRQHPPAAGTSAMLSPEFVDRTLNLLASAVAAGGAPADPWDRVTARMLVLQPVGKAGGGGGPSRQRGLAAAAARAASNPSEAALLREAAMRSAAAELMLGGYGAEMHRMPRMDPYTGELYSDEEDYYDEDDFYEMYDEEGAPLGDYW